MKTRILYTTMLFLLTCLTAGAQERLYVCMPNQCHAYYTEHIDQLALTGDSIRIDGQRPYAVAAIDSIVFCQPQLPIEEWGWQGNMHTGSSRFRAVMTSEANDSSYHPVIYYTAIDSLDRDTTFTDSLDRDTTFIDSLYQSAQYFSYHVEFTYTATDSLCQSAQCTLTFDEEWQKYLFFTKSKSAYDGSDNPYIYVKGSQTGPRHFETWVMGNALLPEACLWSEQPAEDRALQLSSDCSLLLQGRPMSEVKQIVETWLFQPAQRKDNPNYHGVPQ